MGSVYRGLDSWDYTTGNSGLQMDKNEHYPINFTLTPTVFLKNG